AQTAQDLRAIDAKPKDKTFPFVGCYSQQGSGTDMSFMGGPDRVCIKDLLPSGAVTRSGRFEFNFFHFQTHPEDGNFIVHADFAEEKPACKDCYTFRNLEHPEIQLSPLDDSHV